MGDEVILAVGHHIYLTADCERGKDQANYISCKMRELARFLIAMRELEGNPNRSLISCMKPKEVGNIIQATKNVAEYIEGENRFKIPSLAKKVGHLLQKAITIVSGQALAKNDHDEHFRTLEKFRAALNARWTAEISTPALRTLRDRQFNKIPAVPLAADIKKLNDFLTNNIRLYLGMLDKNAASAADLVELSRQTLCLIMCFNRRRAGEAANVKLENVRENIKLGDANREVLASLTKFEQEIIATLSRFETRGKRGQKVPILLTDLMRKGVEAIMDEPNRHLMGIMDENVYLFAVPGTPGSKYRVHGVLPSYAEKCGAQNPTHLRSTKLRKHLATMTQLHNFSKNELDIVAKFMGHDVAIHREFYRLPESTMELAKVGKLLNCLDKGMNMSATTEINAGNEDLEFSESENESPDEIDDDDDCDNEIDNIDRQPSSASASETSTKKLIRRQPVVRKQRQPTVKKPWSQEELNVLGIAFKQFLNVDYLPSKKMIEKAQEKYVLLQARKWSLIKDKIKYLQLKNNKQK